MLDFKKVSVFRIVEQKKLCQVVFYSDKHCMLPTQTWLLLSRNSQQFGNSITLTQTNHTDAYCKPIVSTNDKQPNVLSLRLITRILLCQLLWEPILIVKLLQRLNNNRPWGTETYKTKWKDDKHKVGFKSHLNSSSHVTWEMPADADLNYLHLRGKKENTLVAPIKGLPGSWFGRKLNNPFACGTPTIIYNYNRSFNHSKLRKSLFKKLIRNKWRQVLHREGCRVCGKPHTKWSAFHRGVIQLSLCYLSKCSRLLKRCKTIK